MILCCECVSILCAVTLSFVMLSADMLRAEILNVDMTSALRLSDIMECHSVPVGFRCLVEGVGRVFPGLGLNFVDI